MGSSPDFQASSHKRHEHNVTGIVDKRKFVQFKDYLWLTIRDNITVVSFNPSKKVNGKGRKDLTFICSSASKILRIKLHNTGNKDVEPKI